MFEPAVPRYYWLGNRVRLLLLLLLLLLVLVIGRKRRDRHTDYDGWR